MKGFFKKKLYDFFFLFISLKTGMKRKMGNGNHQRYQIQHTKDHGKERLVDQI